MRTLIATLTVLALLLPSEVFAEKTYYPGKVNSGDDPEWFFADVALWHVMHSRNKRAIDVLVATFPDIVERYPVLAGSEEITRKELDEFIGGCCVGEGEVHAAVVALVFAIIESEGRYQVQKRAPKEKSKKAQKNALARAIKIRNAILAVSEGSYRDYYRDAQQSAIAMELRNRQYGDALRILHADFPRAAAIGTLPNKEVTKALGALDEHERAAFLVGLSTVLAAQGAVGWTGKATKKPAAQKANVKRAIELYKNTGVTDIAIEASILESDPAKRTEYFKFVHEAAVTGQFTTSRGWRHAALMYEELSNQATTAVNRIDRWSTPPEPYYQSCGD